MDGVAKSKVSCLCDVRTILGEGPLWSPHDARLWFVDIKSRRLYRCDLAGGGLAHWDAPQQIGWILPSDDGGYLTGLSDGIYQFDPYGGFTRLVAVEEGNADTRLNDAVVDTAGRVWFGTMDDAEAREIGRFWSFSQGIVQESGLDPVCISNGPAVSPDGKQFYFVDTLNGFINVADVDLQGRLLNPRCLIQIDAQDGRPDGPTVDVEGCIWIALFGGGAVRRYSPKGELLETVIIPVSNITKVAFGGPDMRTVFVTTARLYLNEQQLLLQPQAGSVFTFRSDVPGLPMPCAKLAV
ncbi:SMP-30/gluconolactonase/LRE family protein [Altericroceibacterium endophyticum]|uniref:SMP-30/gluconolactonase/LRE family protein n=1 Tax=Altericroceibacterium endophyticum TaxID=1808508 RepID=A0A6I4T8G0_9SPHN|nr:SMP-30/gluconolactonase/LRE family protein [Altericroceibacterium endophyticum]MXO67077.1 SMP-30/gluconolactonase/LRE family protein [Altericroceibacterium endophyticum]